MTQMSERWRWGACKVSLLDLVSYVSVCVSQL